MNKYEKWYKDITDAGKVSREGCTKKHHIIPKSLGGSGGSNNITYLSAREQFICHWLLTKIHNSGEDHFKMLGSLRVITAENPKHNRYSTWLTSRIHEKLKKEYSKLQSARISGEDNPMHGDKFYRSEEGAESQRLAVTGEKNGAKTSEARKKISESKKGKNREPFSKEWRENLSLARQGEKNSRYGVEMSEDTKKKISEKLSGRKADPEMVAKRAEKQRSLNLKREKILCPHCNQMIAVNTYSRWHGDNCKSKKQ